MTLSSLLLAIFLILVGVTWLAWVTIDIKLLGLLAFITGLVFLVEGVHPLIIYKRP